jgi:hypothetical protein
VNRDCVKLRKPFSFNTTTSYNRYTNQGEGGGSEEKNVEQVTVFLVPYLNKYSSKTVRQKEESHKLINLA